MSRPSVRAEIPLKIVLRTTEYETPRSFFDSVSYLDRALEAFHRRGCFDIEIVYEYPMCLTLTDQPGLRPTRLCLKGAMWTERSTKTITASACGLPLARTTDRADASSSSEGTNRQFTLYLSGSDLNPSVMLEEVCRQVNTLYHQGKFSKFGLSNMDVSQVVYFHKICEARGWITPSVYEGHFYLRSYGGEDGLISALHNLGISIEAYYPFIPGIWRHPPSLSAANYASNAEEHQYSSTVVRHGPEDDATFPYSNKLAEERGINVLKLTRRWAAWHSALQPDLGDAIVVGASDIAQISEALMMLEYGCLQPELLGT